MYGPMVIMTPFQNAGFSLSSGIIESIIYIFPGTPFSVCELIYTVLLYFSGIGIV